MALVRLIGFTGSTRTGSFNGRLVEIAATGARRADAEVEVVDLRGFGLPLYDADREAEDGIPEAALALRRRLAGCDGWIIASPEYNGSVSGALKNAVDWLSRPLPGEAPLALPAFRGKVAGLMSASPGTLGGLRGLSHLQQILAGLGVIISCEPVAVPLAHAAFDDAGQLKDSAAQARIERLGTQIAHFAGSMRAFASRDS